MKNEESQGIIRMRVDEDLRKMIFATIAKNTDIGIIFYLTNLIGQMSVEILVGLDGTAAADPLVAGTIFIYKRSYSPRSSSERDK